LSFMQTTPSRIFSASEFLFCSLAISGCLGLTEAALADDLRYSSAGDGVSRLFQFDPVTPVGLLEAARTAIRLDRPADARGFLKQLMERDAQSVDMLALRREVGLQAFLGLRLDSRLQPEAGMLLKHMQGALPRLSGPELAERAAQMGTGTASGAEAEFEVLAAGEAALPALLSLDSKTQAGRTADALLQEFAADWRHGLLRLLPTSEGAVRMRILELLAGCDSEDVIGGIMRHQFTTSEAAESAAAGAAVRRLSRGAISAGTSGEALEFLMGRAEWLLAAAGERQWAPDPAVAAVGESTGEISLLSRATELLDIAAAIDTGNTRVRQLREIAAAAAADPSPRTPAGPSAGRPTLELTELLRVALAIPQPNAALDILKAMDADGLQAGGGAAGEVLGEAVGNADARIRTLAAALVVRSGVGTRAVSRAAREQLAGVAAGVLKPEAVVMLADGQQRLLYQHLLEDRGFSAVSAGTGPEGFSRAASCVQCELVVLGLYPSRWPAAMTLANLRADVRTRNSTVVLVGPESARVLAESLAVDHGNVVFLAEPVGALTFDSRLAKLRLPPPVLSAPERVFLAESVSGLLTLAGR
jgi:hypothetical protein